MFGPRMSSCWEVDFIDSDVWHYGFSLERHAIVSSPLSGRVVALHVSPGATVECGSGAGRSLRVRSLFLLGLRFSNAIGR